MHCKAKKYMLPAQKLFVLFLSFFHFLAQNRENKQNSRSRNRQRILHKLPVEYVHDDNFYCNIKKERKSKQHAKPYFFIILFFHPITLRIIYVRFIISYFILPFKYLRKIFLILSIPPVKNHKDYASDSKAQ